MTWSQIWQTEPVSCSNDCATTESNTMPLLESSSGNILSCSWPNHSSDVCTTLCLKQNCFCHNFVKISTNSDNFGHKHGKWSKIIQAALIFHLTQLTWMYYRVKHRCSKLLCITVINSISSIINTTEGATWFNDVVIDTDLRVDRSAEARKLSVVNIFRHRGTPPARIKLC